MPRVVLRYGLLLILWGVGTWLWLKFQTEHASVTALIPAFFGAIFAFLGYLGNAKPSLRKHVMHVAAIFSLLGTVASFARSLPATFQWLSGTPPKMPLAVISQLFLGGVCLLLLILCIRSFIAARRARVANES